MTTKPLTSLRSLRQSGFTLMELMLVLGIIALLTVTAIKVGPMVSNQGKITKVQGDIGILGGLITSYEAQTGGRLPASVQVLLDKKIVTDEAIITDPWGHHYVLVTPAKRSKDRYDLYSFGPDGQDGTDDDIGNWDKY